MPDESGASERREVGETEGHEKQFDLSGGRLCLDFANTLGGPVDARREDLETYRDVVGWARQAGIVDDVEADGLLRASRASPADADAALASARDLRGRMARVLGTYARDGAVESRDLAALSEGLAPWLARSRLVVRDGSFEWVWAGPADALDRPLWTVARSTADLLTSPDVALVRECASPTCSWLFVDTSRNHSRRWCDMKSCGNREKARRHYERHKGD